MFVFYTGIRVSTAQNNNNKHPMYMTSLKEKIEIPKALISKSPVFIFIILHKQSYTLL